ncbi:MAG: sulfatase [Myxococcota bacterium]
MSRRWLVRSLSVVAAAAAVVVVWWRGRPPEAVPASESSEPSEPNVVLITVDTLRADHLGCYGHPRPTSPHIDRMARKGVRYERALSQAPWTLPAMATVHTSLYPHEHGAILAETRIADRLPTLAEVLGEAGYATYGVVSHTFVNRDHGFAQGFEVFDQSNVLGHDGVSSEGLTSRSLRFLRAHATNRAAEPFFLWVHYFDPHLTYVRHRNMGFASDPSGELPERITGGMLRKGRVGPKDLPYVKGVYDEEIAHTDDQIGALMEGIENLDTQGNVLYAFTADHGEYFLERGKWAHGRDCYRELTHVPLILGGDIDEDLRGTVVETPVEARSIPTTVMELAGIESHPFGGTSLLDEQAWRGQFRFTEGTRAWGKDDRKSCVVSDRYKLIRHLEDGREELYDIVRDRAERHDLLEQTDAELPKSLPSLRRAVDDHWTDGGEAAAKDNELSQRDKDHLRALGYVE